MITEIPEGQICQAFDPLMMMPEKLLRPDLKNRMSTSCVAPAYVYLEGSRGKRFLCDFHYIFERNMTRDATPHLWPDIEQYMIEKLETIKETFPIGPTERTFNGLCWCGEEGFVSMIDGPLHEFYCNFHWRKSSYRALSNGFVFGDGAIIVDERILAKQTIMEEYNQREKRV